MADPSVERYGSAVNGVHIVRKGETLSHIAARNGTTVSRLMAINGLKKNVIFPGQAIRCARLSRSGKADLRPESAGTISTTKYTKLTRRSL